MAQLPATLLPPALERDGGQYYYKLNMDNWERVRPCWWCASTWWREHQLLFNNTLLALRPLWDSGQNSWTMPCSELGRWLVFNLGFLARTRLFNICIGLLSNCPILLTICPLTNLSWLAPWATTWLRTFAPLIWTRSLRDTARAVNGKLKSWRNGIPFGGRHLNTTPSPVLTWSFQTNLKGSSNNTFS
eukprot:532442-Rhodomonas_salina.4